MTSIVRADQSAVGPAWPPRQLVLLDGEREQMLEQALELIIACRPKRLAWVGNSPIPTTITAELGMGAMSTAIPFTKVQRLLGGECDLLLMDLWTGMDADALGAAVGSLRGGGLLLLLTPRLADWPTRVDPEASRLAVHPYSADQVGTRFIARCARLLGAFPALQPAQGTRPELATTGEQTGVVGATAAAAGSVAETGPMPANPERAVPDPTQPTTADQAEAVRLIQALSKGRARRPLVLTADRGRGKSAALGIAAARLIAEQGLQIMVTAPRRSAVATLFAHATASLRAISSADLRQCLSFQPPDALAQDQIPGRGPNQAPADLLMVDEAAGIPAPLLEHLLQRYPRICFATTVHGYEGTGRGFDLRFRALLEQRTPGWRALRLSTPIRWCEHDPIEQLINRMLLLDAEPAADAVVAAADLSTPQFRIRSRDDLAVDDAALRQLFGLLVLGHYQTRPNDLRHLLDGPNISVATLSAGELILATALIAREGRLEPGLQQPIFEGRRRPRGHLLPQTLSAHAGLPQATALGFARIVRIAVHPAARRRGLARRLLEALAVRSSADGLDLMGASFGASTALLRFWRHCGLAPLHLGTRRNAASGSRAAVVLKALSPAGASLVARARTRLACDLPTLLSGPLQSVEPGIIAALLQEQPPCEPLQCAGDQQQIDAFADAHRTLEAALPALERLVRLQLRTAQAGGEQQPATDGNRPEAISAQQRDLLILSILQRRRSNEVLSALGLSGRAELERQLRRAVQALRAATREP